MAPQGAASTLRRRRDRRESSFPLPGLYNVYNAVGACALCLALEIPLAQIVAGLRP